MTFEQGGSHKAGRAYKMKNGELLTLKDRIAHHTTTALSTVEISSQNAVNLINEFKSFYKNRKPGKYKSYVIKNPNNGSIEDLTQLLDRQNIHYAFAETEGRGTGISYKTMKSTSFEIKPNDLLINTDQPKAVLLDVLMDPSPTLVDSLTYDITSWAMPYAYGLEAYATNATLKTNYRAILNSKKIDVLLNEAYAYAIKPSGVSQLKAIAALSAKDISMRVAQKQFSTQDQNFEKGTWLITRADNKSNENFLETLNEVAKEYQTDFIPIQTGFSKSGPDFGSSSMRLIKKPKVLTLMGEGISPYSFGQVRFYFEQLLGYPLSIVERSKLKSVKWSNYNTLILPEGKYGFSKDELTSLTDWVKSGGKIISISNAANEFANKKGFELKKKKQSKQDSIASAKKPIYSARQRHRISTQAPGAIIDSDTDSSHPYLFGLDGYYSLKTNTLAFDKLAKGNNIAWVGSDPMISGFMGSLAKKKTLNSLLIGSESKGQGSIVYMIDNPLFRGFWYSGNKLFTNVLFMQD